MAKAIWHISNKKSAIRTAHTQADTPQLIKIESEYSLVSTGTERLVAQGRVPLDQYTKMQVPYMEGDFSFPLKYGYSLVGRINTPLHKWHGRLAHLLHPHQDYCWVGEEDISLVPEGIPASRATLASNLETALNAVWDANIMIGDKVLRVGFGLIGALTARLVSMLPATKVIIIEKDDFRRDLARNMGFVSYRGDEPKATYDVAFHTTATSDGLQTAIAAVGKEGKVIELSWYGNQKINIQLGESFHIDRKQIISSQVSNLPANKLARWDYKRRKKTVFDLLKNPIFDEHITHTIAFEDTPKFFERLRHQTPQGLGWCIKY